MAVFHNYDIAWGENLAPAVMQVTVGADGVILDVYQESDPVATLGLDIPRKTF